HCIARTAAGDVDAAAELALFLSYEPGDPGTHFALARELAAVGLPWRYQESGRHGILGACDTLYATGEAPHSFDSARRMWRIIEQGSTHDPLTLSGRIVVPLRDHKRRCPGPTRRLDRCCHRAPRDPVDARLRRFEPVLSSKW